MGALIVILGTAMTLPSPASAVSMTDYTWLPIFVGQSVPPNVLIIVDFGNYTLPAAYSGTNHQYPVSFKSGTTTDSKYASNVTTGNLVAVNATTGGDLGSTTAAPADRFDPNHRYYGMFDPFRCYATSSNSFTHGSVKITINEICAGTFWDGNFLNWLTMRKMDVIYQAIVGGAPKPAQANADGTANSLAGQNNTGENGKSSSTCADNGKSCWRYVKFVPTADLAGRVPTTLAADAAGGVSGRFLGSGEGTLYVNDSSNATADPFDTNLANQYTIQVDLTTEPDVPSGTGSTSGTCNELDPNFAGHLICYKQDRSLGLFQKLRLDAMRVAIMFVDAKDGNAGNMQFKFDAAFNAASVTNIRNQQIQTHSPLAEALYEGLCYYRKSQGLCYNNAPASYNSSVQTQGDAFWFANFPTPQTVSCCKSFVVMISPGVPELDGAAPQSQTPFPNAAAPSVCMFGIGGCGADTLGVTTSWLDNIAYYAQTHDIRDQACPGASCVTGTQSVTFYAVNAMGGAAGSELLASTARYGGFMDRNSNKTPDLTGQSCTPGASFANLIGSTLFSNSVSNSEWDVDRDCVPDTYFDASEGGDLQGQVDKVVADILKRAASGTSVSVLATSSTGEGSIYQAYFFPSQFEGLNEIKWTGFAQGLFVDSLGNIREDYSGVGCTGPPDGRLVLEHDCIIKTRFDTLTNDVKVDRFKDDGTAAGSVAGDGVADTTTPLETVTLKDIKPIWESGERLA